MPPPAPIPSSQARHAVWHAVCGRPDLENFGQIRHLQQCQAGDLIRQLLHPLARLPPTVTVRPNNRQTLTQHRPVFLRGGFGNRRCCMHGRGAPLRNGGAAWHGLPRGGERLLVRAEGCGPEAPGTVAAEHLGWLRQQLPADHQRPAADQARGRPRERAERTLRPGELPCALHRAF